jgi:plasmid stabilization system protein ParE
MNRVIVTPQAEQDIRDIYRRIRRAAPDAARRWSEGIRAQIKTLAKSPERAPLAPESTTFAEAIRQLLYGKGNRGTYRILFTILEKTVFVLHVRHGSMDVLRPQDE